MLIKLINFLTKDLWRIQINQISKLRAFIIKILRITVLSLRGFHEDKCYLRASALTFYSLLSIVPVFAMLFGIARGFALDNRLKEILRNKFETHQEVIGEIISFSETMLSNTKGGLIAGIGIALLVWSTMKLFGNIEESLNYIWGHKKPRRLLRKATDYLSMIMICPIFIIISSSLNMFIINQTRFITSTNGVLSLTIGPIITVLLSITPYIIIWLLFTTIYLFLPNLKIKLTSGLIAGIIAGSIYQATQWLYIHFQIGVSEANAIYGSFAALPLFLIWLQMSWLIVLLGAEISFALQNVQTYEFEAECLNASNHFKNLLSLAIVQMLVKNFCSEEPPLSNENIANSMNAPIRLVNKLLDKLIKANLIIEINHSDKSIAYHPAHDVGEISIAMVLEKLSKIGVEDMPIKRSREMKIIEDNLNAMTQSLSRQKNNIKLKEI